MLRILLVLLISVPISAKSLKLTQPPCIREAVKKCIQDSTSDIGYLRIKGIIDQEVDFSQLRTYSAFKIYRFNYPYLDTAIESFKGDISEFIIPTGMWVIPVYYRGKVLYELELWLKKGKCEFFQATVNNPEIKRSAIEQIDIRNLNNPEKLPILIRTAHDTYAYYPKRKERRLFFVEYEYMNPRDYDIKPAKGHTTRTYMTEVDSKQFLSKARDTFRKARKMREELPSERRPKFSFEPGEE